MKQRIVLSAWFAMTISIVCGQTDRWQQKVKYAMEINVDVVTNRFTGKQKLEYTNNSPDTLKRQSFLR